MAARQRQRLGCLGHRDRLVGYILIHRATIQASSPNAGDFFNNLATCNLQPATCNLQPATCNLLVLRPVA
jgi:hypothetical protein